MLVMTGVHNDVEFLFEEDLLSEEWRECNAHRVVKVEVVCGAHCGC